MKNKKETPLVSIIILTYNNSKYIKNCFDSLLSQNYQNFEVVVIDNNSKDDSVELIKKDYFQQIKIKKIKLILNNENSGFAEGNNIGIRNCNPKSQFICLLNADTKVEKNWLKELIKTIQSDKKIGAVGSVLTSPEDEKELWNNYNQGVWGATNLVGDPVQMRLSKSEIKSKIFEPFFIGGHSLMYKKEIIDEPFQKVYFAYSEDVYLCWLIRLKGYLIKQNLNSYGYHYYGTTKKQNKKITEICIFNGTKNNIMNVLIFLKIKNIIKIFPLFIIGQIGHIIYEPKKIKYKIKAIIWVILNFKKVIMPIRKDIQAKREVNDEEIIKYMSHKIIDEYKFNIKVSKALNQLIKIYCIVFRIKTLQR